MESHVAASTFSTKETQRYSIRSEHIPALTGVRFFAVLHIFMFHLWVLFDMDKPKDYSHLLEGFSRLPDSAIVFFSHGWMSTSFFFILSGFILSYLYWGEDGNLHGGARRFWTKRLIRIFPIHVIVMSITLVVTGSWYLQTRSLTEILPSFLGTLFLVQAWYPPWVPEWSWPTWTISVLLFLYLLMPSLMRGLAKLSLRQMWGLLLCLPLMSLLPTCIYAMYFPSGSEPQQNWQIFISSTPVFWIAQFTAGMLLSRIFKISRFNGSPLQQRWFAWGDLAFVAVIAVALQPGIEEPFKYFLRHGLMMPLYMVIIVDLAKGNGLVARLFSLPCTGFFGETAFALFIWQNLAMIACWMSLNQYPGAGQQQVWTAPLGLILLAILSTYVIEKPIARALRRRAQLSRPPTSLGLNRLNEC